MECQRMAAIDPSKMDPDAAAAHKFLSELRTRITTQPLPYQYGSESRALESLWEVFGQAREAMKTNPGCVQFSTAVTHLLNMHLRPVTAKWDRAHFDGRLDSRDGADEFRADLAGLQLKLREFAVDMQMMAYGAATPDELTPPAMAAEDLCEICADVAFGLDQGLSIPKTTVDDINRDEKAAVGARRDAHGIATPKDVNADRRCLVGGRHPLGHLLPGRRAGAGGPRPVQRRRFLVDGVRRRLYGKLPDREIGCGRVSTRCRGALWAGSGTHPLRAPSCEVPGGGRSERGLDVGHQHLCRHAAELERAGAAHCIGGVCRGAHIQNRSEHGPLADRAVGVRGADVDLLSWPSAHCCARKERSRRSAARFWRC